MDMRTGLVFGNVCYFYSTYKELKFYSFKPKSASILNFYSTYKELKYFFRQARSICILKIFTLPIRNWNLIPMDIMLPPPAIFTLPIRNWNTLTPYFSTIAVKIFTLPIRNWNDDAESIIVSALLNFYSTYKELKWIWRCCCSDAPL